MNSAYNNYKKIYIKLKYDHDDRSMCISKINVARALAGESAWPGRYIIKYIIYHAISITLSQSHR